MANTFAPIRKLRTRSRGCNNGQTDTHTHRQTDTQTDTAVTEPLLDYVTRRGLLIDANPVWATGSLNTKFVSNIKFVFNHDKGCFQRQNWGSRTIPFLNLITSEQWLAKNQSLQRKYTLQEWKVCLGVGLTKELPVYAIST